MHYKELLHEYKSYLRNPEDGGGNEEHATKPLYATEYGDPKKLIDWLTKTMEALQYEASGRVSNMFQNIMFYKGVHSLHQDSTLRTATFDNTPVSMENRFVMQHILEFTHQKQTRLMRFSPNVNVFPWKNEYQARLKSRLGKRMVDSVFYTQELENNHLPQVTLDMAICGEAFLEPAWNPRKGELDKEVEEAIAVEEAYGGFVNEAGEKIDLNFIKRLGDHDYKVHPPFLILHEMRTRWAEVDYIFIGEIKHIDQVKAENAKLSEDKLEQIKLKSSPNSTLAAPVTMGDYVIEWRFYHKDHAFVPGGYYAKFFNDVLIEQGENPYNHKDLPVVRLTDYDDPVNAHGRSFYEALKLPSVMINNMMKIAYRSYCIAAYPKLIAQRDSFDMYSMANGPFVVEYNAGTAPPQLVTFKAVNNDFFPLTEHVERFMEKNSGTFGISRGDQPANARARSILNFYEEQEQERESLQIRKYNAFIEKLARMTLSNCVQFYDPADERTLKIVGSNNTYKMIKLSEKLDTDTDLTVKIQRTTALSESKQGRIDQISTLSSIPLAEQEGTGLFTREQILSLIEVGDTSTFFEMATQAAERAHSENEDIFEGLEVPAPEEFQSHLVDWNVHFYWMQSREFSDTQGVPPEVKEAMIDHLMIHEQILYRKAKANIKLATILSGNPYFPAVMNLDERDLPLSQIVMMLSQPPLPPAPMGAPPMVSEGEPLVDDTMMGDTPAPDPLATQDPLPEDMQPMADGLPVS